MILQKMRFGSLFAIGSVLVLCASLPILGEQGAKDPIDAQMEKSLRAHSDTGSTIQANVRAEKQWDKELNKVYQSLLKEIPASAKPSLLAAQKAWIAYRDADFRALKDHIDDSAKGGGTIWGIIYADSRREVVRNRVWRLRDLGSLETPDESSEEKPHPLDVQLDKALRAHSDTQSIEQAQTLFEKQWDKEMNRVYQNVMKGRPASVKTSLRAAQKAWIAYRDADFLAAQKIMAWKRQEGGTIWGGVLANHRLMVVRNRALHLGLFGSLEN